MTDLELEPHLFVRVYIPIRYMMGSANVLGAYVEEKEAIARLNAEFKTQCTPVHEYQIEVWKGFRCVELGELQLDGTVHWRLRE